MSFLFHQSIDTVQSNTTVVTYDTATAISIWKTGNDLVVTNFFHLWCVSIEYTLVVSSAVLSEDLVQFWVWSISVSLASLLSHLDTAIWHECSL